MAITRMAGAGIGLTNAPLTGNNNVVTLGAGEQFVFPAGQFWVTPGPYSFVQTKDPVSGVWRNQGGLTNTPMFVNADGVNVRLINMTGCALGAVVTNAGSAYTSAPTVSCDAGGSTWVAVVGGSIGNLTFTGNGTGYNYPPQVVIGAPPVGGVQATAVASLSSGNVTTSQITMTNNGAGYKLAPSVTFIPDPREASATTPGPTKTPVATGTLVQSGNVTAVLCTNHGTPLTTVGNLTFTGGGGSSAAATVVPVWTTTGFAIGNAGTGYGTTQNYLVQAVGGINTSTAASNVSNPQLGPAAFTPRQGSYIGTTGSGNLTSSGNVTVDGGLFTAVPFAVISQSGTGNVTTPGNATFSVGGVTDTSYVQPF